jgi:TRAP-type mannitol/chloroaromatic compound transport system substrate-binding protein
MWDLPMNAGNIEVEAENECRRSFARPLRALIASVAALLVSNAAFAATPEHVEGPKLEWSMSWWGKPRPITAGSEFLARQIWKRTGGAWTIKIHYGARLAKADENLDRLASGNFEAGAFCNFFHPNKNPALMALSMPFLPLDTWETNRKVRDAAYADPAIVSEFARQKVKLYVSTYLPPFEFMGTGTAPLQIGDWERHTVRAGGALARAMMVLDAKVSDVGSHDMLDGLKNGTITAVSLPHTYGHAAYGIHNLAGWFTANLAAGSFDCPLAFSAGAYDTLPRQYKRLLETLRPAVAEIQLEAYRQADVANLQSFRSRLTEVRYGREQLLDYRRIAGRPVIDEWIETNRRRFNARRLIETLFEAAGEKYE